MKYIPIDASREISARLDKIEESVNNLITDNNKRYDYLRGEIMKYLAELREEIININLRAEKERERLQQKRIKAIKQFKGE
jgi:hypothetical protein